VTDTGQSPVHPFTFDKIHKVTRLFVAEPQATLVARSLFAEEIPPASGELERPSKDSSPSLPHSDMRGVTFTPDMLALLSLLSEETNQKVERYFKSSFPMNATERAEWVLRREELLNVDEVKSWLHLVGSDPHGH
jgi:hypothetical protein